MKTFDYNFDITRLVLITVSFESILGISLNSILVVILFRLRYRLNSSFIIMLFIALCDIITASSTLSLGLLHSLLGYKAVFASSWYCRGHSFFLIFSRVISRYLVSFLALERYALICHQKNIMSRTIGWALVLFAMLYGGIFITDSFFNIYFLDPSHIFCKPDIRQYHWSLVYFRKSSTIIPVVILTFCYLSIFLSCYRASHRNLEYFNSRLPVRALVFMIFYFICYFPEFLGSIWEIADPESGAPLVIYILIPITLTLVTAINPIIVLFLQDQIGNEVNRMFSISGQSGLNSLTVTT